MQQILVVITGASGSVYGLRLIEQIVASGRAVTLVVTPAGRDVLAHETGLGLPEDASAAAAVCRFLEIPVESPLRVVGHDDLFDRVASGSSVPDAMVVCPASMGFCSAVAHGTSSDLPERAADVMLKERCPLVLVPRETPLSLVHLRNLTAAAEAGAIVIPAMPAFYHGPATLDDAVNFVVGKVLDQLGITHTLFRRWGE